ncbi:nuclease-related domain-containing protein [Gloeobacter kilaueensis]|uniref:NERD domain-containing protein n=1 Tax=Gloeobacter kilaueensis (strain ATCC BAA-2537 / CCAP 1431/1 / ULC 316 / JS1) TaxID=1183438 RepID=U5QFS5_GLOK1|nr:nuclease-related domain-containing protein [Gloeobacter kilaueensis]AGY56459.1 hypothetical protein GKIL_0212 [Gloeobacter kilaueensis JS1]
MLRRFVGRLRDVLGQSLVALARFSMALVFLAAILSLYGGLLLWIAGWFQAVYLKEWGALAWQGGTRISALLLNLNGFYTFPSGFRLPLAPLAGGVFLLGVGATLLQPSKLFLRLYLLNLGGAALIAATAGGIRLFLKTAVPPLPVAYLYLTVVGLVLAVCLLGGPFEWFQEAYRWQWKTVAIKNPAWRPDNRNREQVRLEHRVSNPDPYDAQVGRLLVSQLTVEGILLTGVSVPYKNDILRLDNVLLCDRGVFVIEGKSYTGTIEGNLNNVWRTSTGDPIKSSRGNNPLQQCDAQVLALKNFFAKQGFEVFIKGIVLFPDRARFAIEGAGVDVLAYSTAVPVFHEQQLIEAINTFRPPGRSLSRAQLTRMADAIL